MLEAVGPYRLEDRLAVGGMANIYLARETLFRGLDRQVVVKCLLPDRRSDEEFVTMFFDEARMMARLKHPNIAQVFAAGSADGEHYLVMEYVKGASLRDLLTSGARAPGGTVPLPEFLRVALSIAEALSYVHDATDESGRHLRIVHRDLTPANVMVGYDGAAKVIDFGIARGENRVYETSTGVLKGTCGYMAPEQLVEGGELDLRVDVFGFGVILYESVVGVHPFQAASPTELFTRLSQAEYERPRAVRSELSESLEDLITACMSRSPGDRPYDMHRVAECLREELLGMGRLPLLSEVGAMVRTLCPVGVVDSQVPAPAQLADSDEWITEVDRRRKVPEQ